MKFPMIPILIYYILGILTGIAFQGDLVSISLFSVAIFIAILLLSIYYKWPVLKFLIIIYLLGIIITSNNFTTATISDGSVNINGIVTSTKKTTNGYVKVYLDIINSKEKIYFIDVKNNNLKVSDVVELKGTLKELSYYTTDYGYNEFLYERARGASFKMFPDEINVLGYTKNIKYYLYNLRYKISENFSTIFPPEKSAIVEAIVLGNRDNFDEDISNIFKVGGIYHILAISGLHISLLATALLILLKKIVDDRLASIITMTFLILYGILTGLSISVVRAILMFSIILIAPIIHRKNNSINSIFVSAFILLIFQPLYLFQAGFLLSYSAVIGIILFSPIIMKFINFIIYKSNSHNGLFIKKFSHMYFAPALSAFLFTTPILCYYYDYIYPYTILVNIILAPTIPIFVFCSFVVGIISLLSLSFATYLGYIVSIFIEIYIEICNFVSDLPFAKVHIENTSIVLIIFYYFSLLFIYIYINNNRNIFNEY